MLKKLLKKNKIPNPVVPRSQDEIIAQYQSKAYQAGNAQYNISVQEAELVKLNAEMRELNLEMAERQKLDRLAKEAEVAEKSQAAQGVLPDVKA